MVKSFTMKNIYSFFISLGKVPILFCFHIFLPGAIFNGHLYFEIKNQAGTIPLRMGILCRINVARNDNPNPIMPRIKGMYTPDPIVVNTEKGFVRQNSVITIMCIK